MPITKQAIKRVKQAKGRTERNRHNKSHMKSMMKLVLDYVDKKELDKATKILPKVVHAIDNAAKKNIIHKNNASRKKSRVQRALNTLAGNKVAPKKTEDKKETEAPTA